MLFSMQNELTSAAIIRTITLYIPLLIDEIKTWKVYSQFLNPKFFTF